MFQGAAQSGEPHLECVSETGVSARARTRVFDARLERGMGVLTKDKPEEQPKEMPALHLTCCMQARLQVSHLHAYLTKGGLEQRSLMSSHVRSGAVLLVCVAAREIKPQESSKRTSSTTFDWVHRLRTWWPGQTVCLSQEHTNTN